MTATAARSADTGKLPVHDGDGRVIATIGHARSSWLGQPLAECDRGHVYLFDDLMAGCPVCGTHGLDEPLHLKTRAKGEASGRR